MWNVTNIALDRSIASSLSQKTYSGQAALTIGAIGVVLGNIGTSPLYAVDQIFYGPAHLAPTPDNVLGCISLAIWALTLIVSLKYAVFILRADNDGEGGVSSAAARRAHARRRLPVRGQHHLTRHQRAGGGGGP